MSDSATATEMPTVARKPSSRVDESLLRWHDEITSMPMAHPEAD